MINLADKKILVTGGAGFLGSHIVAALQKRGVPDANIRVPRSVELDLRDIENCTKAVVGIDVVIHAAGMTGGIEFHKNHPGQIFYNNLMMGVQLMDAARQAGVQKFVTIGSATEYPEGARLPFKEDELWDGIPEAIHIPYTVAKKMLSVQADAYRRQFGFNAVHLLMTNMYGPGEKKDSSFVIPSLIRRVVQAQKDNAAFIEVWGSGKPTRDFLYVKDAAEGILLAAEKYDSSDPVNLGSGWEISIKELATMICRLTNFPGELRWNTQKPDGQMRRVMDTAKAEHEFGFKASTDFETGLKETVADYA